MGVPLGDVRCERGDEALHVEAELVRAAECQAGHDGQQGALDVDAVTLTQQHARDEHSEDGR